MNEYIIIYNKVRMHVHPALFIEIEFSLCHFACLLRSFHPLLPDLWLRPSAHLLMGLQLLYELIQDLLGWQGGHVHNFLLQKRYLYPSLSTPAVATHMGLLRD